MPYMPDRAHILEQLRTCRTFSYPEVMAKAADEIEKMADEIEALREARDFYKTAFEEEVKARLDTAAM